MEKITPRDMAETKRENRKSVLDAFRTTTISTVAEAAELCGLSRATAHRVVEFLRKKNLLLAIGKGASTDEGGKKPTLLTLNAGYKYILCYQILQNALMAAISDMRGKLLTESSYAFPDNTPLDTILGLMKSAYGTMTSGLHLEFDNFAGIVVGSHGITDWRDGIVSGSAYFTSWGADIPFSRLVADLFPGSIPVHIDNWNRYDAYAEMRIGLGRGVDNFMVIDGEVSGIGAGVVLNGELWRGNRFLAGEIGHMTVDSTGQRTCTCGAKGCLEIMASMNALVDSARAGYADHKQSLLFANRAPDEISYRDVYDSANAGDRLAQKAVADQARWLAIAIANVSLAADPDLVILQGPFAKGGDYFFEQIRLHLDATGLPQIKKAVGIAASPFGRERGLVGGALYVADRFFVDPALYQ